MHRLALAYYLILSIHLAGQLFQITWVDFLTKPLLMPLLVWLVWAKDRTFSGHGLVVAALGFSWLGDVLLLPPEGTFFVFGLGSFLLAHAFYIRLFLRDTTYAPFRLLPFVVYAVLLLSGPLRGKLPGELRVPVYAYIAVLTGMGCVAALRNSRQAGYEQILLGAVLFILSDSFLALNKFVSPLPLEGFWVMLTYGLAQYFIVKGYLSAHSVKN